MRKMRSSKRKKRSNIALFFTMIGVVLGAYVGVWVMFISPVLNACALFDTGGLTATVIGITILKCLLASPIGWGVFYIATLIGVFIGERF